MKDVRGETLKVGDEVYIYWGYNNLRPGVIKEIKGQKAKVLVDSYPKHSDPDVRYSMSKLKDGECMIKAPEPTGYYPDEVILLLEEIRRLRDQETAQEGKQQFHQLLNYWDMKRPINLVCS